MKTCAIIIPAYNCHEYILDCVKSVMNQKKIENIQYDMRVGVDGCQKTSDILRKNNIPFYFSNQNVGAYVMRNSLMYLRPADYYIYFDADDIMNHDFIFQCIQKIDNGCEIVMPAKIECDKNMNRKNNRAIVQDGGAMCFTNKVLESLGGFCSARCASDTDFMRRAEMAGYQICKIDHALYKRRRHEKSLTKSGMTAFGGKYRKEVWKKMTEERERGMVKIVPQRIELYFTN